MSKTDGGPAYPQPMVFDGNGTYTTADLRYHDAGLSKLEAFALAAMQGDWANRHSSWTNSEPEETLKRRASLYYRMARAMIEVGEEEA